MSLKKRRLIIFKTDRVGDFLHLTGCIKTIRENFHDAHITLVCSSSNYQLAKNYPIINTFIIIDKFKILKTLLINFRSFFTIRYDHLFVLDGKKRSFILSYFVKSRNKNTICFVKQKRIFGFNYLISRPSKIILKFFFNNYVLSDENYSNTEIIYQNLYFKLLSQIDLKIKSKQNFFVPDPEYKEIFNSFYDEFLKKEYYLIHIDERWDQFNLKDITNTLNLIKFISKKKFIIITTGAISFNSLKEFVNKFPTYEFLDNGFHENNSLKFNNVCLLKFIPLNLLAYFIANSKKNISAHTGPILNISSAFNIEVVDIIKKDKFNELGRWIPLVANYKRISFENLEHLINDF
tara:strand:- start:256 stop:1302 length:1047 start_codon:yes stop_codon:yes gene_type:complete